MVKVRVRSVVNRRIGTRGTVLAKARDDAVVKIFNEHRGKLIDAHGSLVGANRKEFEVVPPDTVVMFMADVGKCAITSATRELENEYFTTAPKIKAFFRGAAAVQGRHYGNTYNKTWLPGEKYPSVMLWFNDETTKNMGYVYPLPLPYRRPVNGGVAPFPKNILYPKVNNGNQPRGPEHYMLLQDLMHRLGKGVYIVDACIVPPGQIGKLYPEGRLPVNLPKRMDPNIYPPSLGHKRIAPLRTRETIRAGIHKSAKGALALPKRPPRPGSRIFTHIREGGASAPRRNIQRISIRQALRTLSRAANIESASKLYNRVNKMLPKMNANVNGSRIAMVAHYLQNPAEFLANWNSANTTANFYNLNKLDRGAYIYRKLYNSNIN